ncbi:hypothetical protein [Amycolatopsis sp. cmx-11-51]|uniref:hypothetical protein n=1 Tax=unclassified Amycolatopsis TaxID=2618356 RepID=UPI0039E69C0B
MAVAFDDVPGDVGGVVADETEQGRAGGPLPRQAEDVQSVDRGVRAVMAEPPTGERVRDVYPNRRSWWERNSESRSVTFVDSRVTQTPVAEYDVLIRDNP